MYLGFLFDNMFNVGSKVLLLFQECKLFSPSIIYICFLQIHIFFIFYSITDISHFSSFTPLHPAPTHHPTHKGMLLLWLAEISH